VLVADQGRWFKLWISALSDPDLRNLSLEDFGRWCAFGAYLKEQGQEGRLSVRSPAVALQELFRLPHFEAVVKVLESFPNCTVRVTPHVTNAFVTLNIAWANWQKYQVDNSAERTKKWRERKRAVTVARDDHVTVIEEKRSRREVEEKRRDESSTPLTPQGGKSPTLSPAGFDRFYTAYPKHEAREAAIRAWRKLGPDADLLTKMLVAIDHQRAGRKWQEGIIPMPSTWLNQRRWEDEVEASLPFDAKTAENIRAGQAVLDRLKGKTP